MRTNVISKVENPTIDSLKIRIPLHQVEIKNESIKGSWILVNDITGEVSPGKFKENSYAIKQNGISVRFGIESQNTANRKVETFLVILVNSKLLKREYFDGITEKNVGKVYDELIKYDVVSFSYKSFLSAECTDVDIKKDCKMSLKGFDDSISSIEQHARPSKKRGQGYRRIKEKTNQGIEFSERKTTSFCSNPFFKIYHKELELNNNSSEFADKYLSEIDYSDTVRFECTIKNKKHFRYLGVDETTLKNILELPINKMNEMMSTTISKHLEKRIIEIRTISDLSPNSMIIYNMIIALMSFGHSFDNIKNEVALNGIKNKSKRSQKAKDLSEIYSKYIKDSILDKTTKEVDNFANFIGWS